MKRILEQLFTNEYNIGWQQKTLKDVLTRVRRPVDVDPEEEYQEIGIYSHGKGIFHKKKVTGQKIGNKAVYWVEPDCFVFNIIFAWEQAVAKTTDREKGMIASHRFPMYKPKEGVLDLDYILYFFKTKQGKYLLNLASPGGAGRNKTLGQIGFQQLTIPLPSYTEQLKIVDIISTWDEAIEKTEALIEEKERLKKGLMQQLLTGKKRFPGFENEKWKKRKLKELCKLHYGQSQKGIPEKNGKYSIYGTGGIVGKTNQYLFNKPSIIIGRKGTIDKPTLVKRPFWAIDTVFYTEVNSCVDVEWLFYYLDSIRLSKYNEAGGVPSLSRKNLYEIRVDQPSRAEQNRISSLLSNIDVELLNNRNQLEAFKLQKKGLMQQLLTGKRRVNT